MRSAHCEIRQGENVTLQYLSHDGRPAPRRAARRHRTFANGKIPVARPGRHSVEFRLVREENGNALPGDRARRSRPGARQPLGGAKGPQPVPLQCDAPPSVKCRPRLWTAGTPWSQSGNPVGSDIDPLHGVFGERAANRGWEPWFLRNLALRRHQPICPREHFPGHRPEAHRETGPAA
jgi:hypothetical protein